MKHKRNFGALAFIVSGLALMFCVSAIANSYLSRQARNGAETAQYECKKYGGIHTANIQDNRVNPQNISAALCDKLTIINNDAAVREIGFGPHDQHIPYNGISERVLEKSQSFTVVLNSSGAYSFHDHFQEDVKGTFQVK